MDIREHNARAWDRQVEEGNRWTVPVTPDEVAAARAGRWGLLLTPSKPVPRDWFPPVAGSEILCLASGGGQQGPSLAAAGGRVTVIDNSPAQLARDREVAERESLPIRIEEGDMADLSRFDDGRFDLIVHPVSNCFAPDIAPVWREAYRVLKPGGALLSGFANPVIYIFDEKKYDAGELVVRHSLPYSEPEDMPAEIGAGPDLTGRPFEFSHSLAAQIGGQIDAGFVLTGFYEDSDPEELLTRTMPCFIATRAVRPGPVR